MTKQVTGNQATGKPRGRNGGRPPKSDADRLYQIGLYVDKDTLEYLRSLPRAEAAALKRRAAQVLTRPAD